MKVFGILTFGFIGALIAGCAASAPADSATSPFDSVVVRENKIVVKLPASPRWIVKVGSSDSRHSEPGESFTLLDGSSLRLVEDHLSYKVTAQLAPTPGLKVESEFDARSFGGSVTNRTYFIPAM